jgi:tetratricopeptide (TPR) repeat protein
VQPSRDEAWSERGRQILLGVGLLALAVRALYLWQIHDAAFFDLRMGDGDVYHRWAQRIAGGDWWGDRVYYQAPLYPYLLALIYRLVGDSPLTVRLVQALMGAGSCVLLAGAARSLFGGRAGLLAGLGLALYPPAIFHDGLIQKAALGTLLTTALIALLCAQVARATPHRWVGAGVMLGLLALTRENALVFALLVLVWILAEGRGLLRRRALASAGLFLAGAALVLLPVGLRNLAVGGEFQLTTSQLGPNFYIGNNPRADGSYQPLSFGRGDALREREDATRIAERAEGRPLTPAEVSRFWLRRSRDYIRAEPVGWITLMARKLALTFNAAELPDTESQEVFADHSALLRGLGFFHFGLLLPAAAFGAVMTAPAWRRIRLLYLLIAGYAASVALFYVFARYRFPLVPLLILLAAGGAVEAVDRLRAGRYRGPAVAVAVALLTAVVANLPLHSAQHSRAVHYFNIGSELHRDPALLDQAIEFYERALAVAPDYPEALFGLGGALARDGRWEPAISHYREALAIRPDYPEAHYGMGRALAQVGRLNDAVSHYREALAMRPDYADAHVALGTAITDLGRPGAALEHHRRALSLEPEHVEAYVGLGVALIRLNRFDEAIAQCEDAIRLDPRHAVAHNNLGSALAMQGRVADAAGHFARALEIDPDYDEARRNLTQARRILSDRN